MSVSVNGRFGGAVASTARIARIAAVGSVGGSFALPGVTSATALFAFRHYRALPAVAWSPSANAAGRRSDWPRVSIIVPARDEQRNLPRVLDSLLALDYPDYEILVVDDDSRDATPLLAEEYATRSGGRLHVLRRTGPEPGWTGKNAACWAGANAANGEWLLFTDADTEHAPKALRAAVGAALDADAGALSLFTAQRCLCFWERLLLPFAYQQYFVGVRPRTLACSRGPALANGQYFLISRRAYHASGGHAAVAASIIDDVALATALKRAGFPPLTARGEALVSVRMYDSLAGIAQGFTKNSAQFLREQSAAGLLVVLSTGCAAAIAPALARGIVGRKRTTVAGAVSAYVVQALGLLPWLRAFGVPRRYALLAPLASLSFTAIALSSAWHTLAHRPVQWKGRGYRTTPALPDLFAARNRRERTGGEMLGKPARRDAETR